MDSDNEFENVDMDEGGMNNVKLNTSMINASMLGVRSKWIKKESGKGKEEAKSPMFSNNDDLISFSEGKQKPLEAFSGYPRVSEPGFDYFSIEIEKQTKPVVESIKIGDPIWVKGKSK